MLSFSNILLGSVNVKGLLRLAKAGGKFLVLSTVFESIQKWDIEKSYLEYYTFMYLVGACLYLMFNVLLDVVGLFWEFAFNMKPKEISFRPIHTLCYYYIIFLHAVFPYIS